MELAAVSRVLDALGAEVGITPTSPALPPARPGVQAAADRGNLPDLTKSFASIAIGGPSATVDDIIRNATAAAAAKQPIPPADGSYAAAPSGGRVNSSSSIASRRSHLASGPAVAVGLGSPASHTQLSGTTIQSQAEPAVMSGWHAAAVGRPTASPHQPDHHHRGSSGTTGTFSTGLMGEVRTEWGESTRIDSSASNAKRQLPVLRALQEAGEQEAGPFTGGQPHAPAGANGWRSHAAPLGSPQEQPHLERYVDPLAGTAGTYTRTESGPAALFHRRADGYPQAAALDMAAAAAAAGIRNLSSSAIAFRRPLQGRPPSGGVAGGGDQHVGGAAMLPVGGGPALQHPSSGRFADAPRDAAPETKWGTSLHLHASDGGEHVPASPWNASPASEHQQQQQVQPWAGEGGSAPLQQQQQQQVLPPGYSRPSSSHYYPAALPHQHAGVGPADDYYSADRFPTPTGGGAGGGMPHHTDAYGSGPAPHYDHSPSQVFARGGSPGALPVHMGSAGVTPPSDAWRQGHGYGAPPAGMASRHQQQQPPAGSWGSPHASSSYMPGHGSEGAGYAHGGHAHPADAAGHDVGAPSSAWYDAYHGGGTGQYAPPETGPYGHQPHLHAHAHAHHGGYQQMAHGEYGAAPPRHAISGGGGSWDRHHGGRRGHPAHPPHATYHGGSPHNPGYGRDVHQYGGPPPHYGAPAHGHPAGGSYYSRPHDAPPPHHMPQHYHQHPSSYYAGPSPSAGGGGGSHQAMTPSARLAAMPLEALLERERVPRCTVGEIRAFHDAQWALLRALVVRRYSVFLKMPRRLPLTTESVRRGMELFRIPSLVAELVSRPDRGRDGELRAPKRDPASEIADRIASAFSLNIDDDVDTAVVEGAPMAEDAAVDSLVDPDASESMLVWMPRYDSAVGPGGEAGKDGCTTAGGEYMSGPPGSGSQLLQVDPNTTQRVSAAAMGALVAELVARRRYKTKLCHAWLRTGGNCPRGASCDYAHGQEEMRVFSEPRDARFKTRLCRVWLDTCGMYCSHGDRCSFAHGVAELHIHLPAGPVEFAEDGRPIVPPDAMAAAYGQAGVPRRFRPHLCRAWLQGAADAFAQQAINVICDPSGKPLVRVEPSKAGARACPRGDACMSAHGLGELRLPSQSEQMRLVHALMVEAPATDIGATNAHDMFSTGLSLRHQTLLFIASGLLSAALPNNLMHRVSSAMALTGNGSVVPLDGIAAEFGGLPYPLARALTAALNNPMMQVVLSNADDNAMGPRAGSMGVTVPSLVARTGLAKVISIVGNDAADAGIITAAVAMGLVDVHVGIPLHVTAPHAAPDDSGADVVESVGRYGAMMRRRRELQALVQAALDRLTAHMPPPPPTQQYAPSPHAPELSPFAGGAEGVPQASPTDSNITAATTSMGGSPAPSAF